MKTPWWFGHKTPLAFMLVPVSWVYWAASRLVYKIRGFRAYTSRRPVICIGNILAGGVGKTPIVRALANEFDAPVVCRGYKKGAKTGNIGDEAAMLAADGLQVHTGNRRANVMLLDRQADNTPIIMDDGYQNPTVKKTVSVLVFDESVGMGNGFLLPAGPLRQGRRAISGADAVIVIKSGAPARKNFMLPTNIPVFYAHTKTVSPYSRATKVVAFAGIGYPKKFFRALPGVVATRSFADHHQYTDGEIAALYKLAARRGAKLVTTQKDWMRLGAADREKIKYAELKIDIDNAFFEWLRGKTNADTEKKG